MAKTAKTSTRTAAAKPAVKKSAKPAPAKAAQAAKKPADERTTAFGAGSGKAAHPPKYMQPLESYSPYAQHRILLEKWGTDEAGQAKVMKYGTEVLGLPAPQVKTYIREKLQAILRDDQKKAGLHPTKPQLEAKSFHFEPEFKFKTRADAIRRLQSICKTSHTTERAYHIVSEGGKFAVVPAHIMPAGKPPQFKKGDIVMDTIIGDSRAKVIDSGPEQSIVEYLSERKYAPKEQCVSNYYLVKLDSAALKAFAEEEKQREAAKKTEPAPAKKAAPKKKKAAPQQKAAAVKKSSPAKKSAVAKRR